MADETNKSEQALKDYIARGGKAVDNANGESFDAENIDEVLKTQVQTRKSKLHERVVEQERRSAEREDNLQQREQRRAQANAETKAAAQKKEAERNARLKEQEDIRRQGKTLTAIQQGSHAARENFVDPLIEQGGRAVDKISSVRTVGGIGLLLVILFLLLFFIVPVNAAGDTRAKEFWYMLNGRSHLEGRKTVTGGTGGDNQNGVQQTSQTVGNVAVQVGTAAANPLPSLGSIATEIGAALSGLDTTFRGNAGGAW